MRRVPEDRFLTDQIFYVTLATLDRDRVFSNDLPVHVVSNSLQFFRTQREIELHGFVIMPDHVHVILRVVPPLKLPDWARRFKSYTAHALGGRRIWQKGYWSETIVSESFLREKLLYIHENPVRAGLSGDALKYAWSSAAEYQEQTFRQVDPYWESGRFSYPD
ncbi:MAG: transposase [bacterium]|nr:transposase [bacterium]